MGGGLLVLLCATAAPAWAQALSSPCPDADALRLDPRGAGPLPSGSGPADFGLPPEACPGFDVLSRLRLTLLVARDGPDYYGNLGSGAFLRVRFPLNQDTWMSVAADLVTFRYVANAVVRSSSVDVGPPTVGIYRALPPLGGGAPAVYARGLLPLDSARISGIELGAEVGASYFRPWRQRLAFQGGLAVPVPIDLTGGQAHAALRPAVLVDGVWRAARVVALTLGAGGRFQVAPDPAVLAVSARLGVRVALARGFMFAAAAEAPFAGTDLTDLIASLFLGWTPGGRSVRSPR